MTPGAGVLLGLPSGGHGLPRPRLQALRFLGQMRPPPRAGPSPQPHWSCTPQARAPLPALLGGCGLPSGSGLDSDSPEGPMGGGPWLHELSPGQSPSLLGHERHRQGLPGPALLSPQAHSGAPHPPQGHAGQTRRDFCPSLTVRELGSCPQPLRHTWELHPPAPPSSQGSRPLPAQHHLSSPSPCLSLQGPVTCQAQASRAEGTGASDSDRAPP